MDLVSLFPGLAVNRYHVTSPTTSLYNCFAWAAGETHRWWEAHPDAGHYWPTGHTTDWSIDVVIAAYATIGYSVCSDGDPDPAAEKIAVYVLDGEPKHAARLLPSGTWTSKLGAEDDIEHTLEGLEGDEYGKATLLMSRILIVVN